MPDEVGHAADVDVPRGEGRGDGGLGHGEGDAGVGRLQGPAVVAAVAAHYDLPPCKMWNLTMLLKCNHATLPSYFLS